ncbi:hypothetical protein QNI19_11375 [Cytophagaceae bacterium DM2B3-1]|uniref:Uncharacterized protein n=1 Tax=Xanthocytophaga flava TaxID=3048013 RepID=A0ABT7CKM0_9BACT|nr:hypothetical protein [Xanthocytophaga flavus]MDJ1469590.1 hypothetical protein [Xanthocytophaga flavus]MDJ1493535.1 hypothetical protein [Xanthocytophaga flavus]
MHKQKKHPVDDLFARRLYDVEKMPSSRVWDELQGRMTKKKESRKGVYFSIAAAIALLILGLVGIRYWREDTGTQMAVSDPHKVSKTTPVKSIEEKAKAENTKKVEITRPRAESTTTYSDSKTEISSNQKSEKSEKQTKKKTLSPVEQNTDKLIAKSPDLPVIEKKTTQDDKVIVTQKEEIIASAVPSVKPESTSPGSTVTVVVVEVADESLTASTKGDTTEPIARKAGKLWQAIKKAKKSEINLDKEAIVAWVKDRNTKN